MRILSLFYLSAVSPYRFNLSEALSSASSSLHSAICSTRFEDALALPSPLDAITAYVMLCIHATIAGSKVDMGGGTAVVGRGYGFVEGMAEDWVGGMVALIVAGGCGRVEGIGNAGAPTGGGW